MAGTTAMVPSVDAMPVNTRSGRPTFSMALARTSDVAIASDGANGFVLGYTDAAGGFAERLVCEKK